MEIKVLEKDDERLKIEVDDLTLVNLLNENLWKRKIELSTYAVEHPYLSKPVLLVKSKNPKKSLIDATERIVEDVQKMKEALKKSK